MIVTSISILYISASIAVLTLITLSTASTAIIVFILFGSFLSVSGATALFNDLALAIAGRRRGGPAQVAVISSALTSSLSGRAVRLALPGFIIPLILVYNPALLMQGNDLNVLSILYMIMTALIGIYSLSIATSNFWMIKAHWLERVLFTIAAILLIKPGIWTDLVGNADCVIRWYSSPAL
ncbi:DUF3394 domain-containing protein [Xenorhabdus cabanillasii]|uniref:DUF3394 domain-containing protein n=1 Tax=Xenorhabdus cabanillasii TaxID=351673 RepID=UPI000E23C44F|nr:DUF3394 domain-containing protein [Xenorhabdus cabanillasii]